MKANILRNLLLGALLFSLVSPLVTGVQASGPFATNYSNASLTGVYGYSLFGWVLGHSSPTSNTTNQPIDVVGVMWFDGNGTFMFHDTYDSAGNVAQRGTADNPIVGTYTVNPDGTGTISAFGLQPLWTFAIVDGGQELQFGTAHDQATNRGVAKKQ